MKTRVDGASKARMWGFPHSNEPDEGKLWVGVTLKGGSGFILVDIDPWLHRPQASFHWRPYHWSLPLI
ncbi:MAG: hypothetical protein QXG13_06240 [Zestosphaera sp.]